MCIAHIDEKGNEQSVLEHLEGTANLAGAFAAAFDQQKLGYAIGMAHDIGKYSRAFQAYITAGDASKRGSVDHSTAAAQELRKLGMMHAAFCAAGHHAGLPDGGNHGNTADDSTLIGRLARKVEDYSRYAQEVQLEKVKEPRARDEFVNSFFTRMLFSCLVDADFLDTEAFMSAGTVKRGGYASIGTLFARLENEIVPWLKPTDKPLNAKSTDKWSLNAKRTEILRECLAAGKGPRGLYTLTVPTGGGKTVSSLAFALQHAQQHDRQRVIYVIPYTNIVEQTARVFADIVGADNVLAHHSNAEWNQASDDDPVAQKRRLAAENWDAPLIVTTNVQFFESLYANKTSRCRKLHNIVNSVVIFDEAQMLPLEFLRPCVRAIAELVQHYGVTAVLCTATQPALQPLFPANMQAQEICQDTAGLYQFFKRTTLRHIGPRSKEQLAADMQRREQALAIVATRKQAAELFALLPKQGSFHLSTLMYPAHRKRVLDTVRARKAGERCRLVSTSLIEAGVDVDFPEVFRAEAGLDSVIQSAGRCNREGKKPAAESFVNIYQPEDAPPPLIQKQVCLLHEVQRRHSDLSAPEAIHDYFDAMHRLAHGDSVVDDGLDKLQILPAIARGINGCKIPFAQIADMFHLIGEDSCTVLIPLEKPAFKIAVLLRRGDYSRSLMRQAGPYMVSVYPSHFQALVDAGDVELLAEKFGVLTNEKLYDAQTGLSLQADGGKAQFS